MADPSCAVPNSDDRRLYQDEVSGLDFGAPGLHPAPHRGQLQHNFGYCNEDLEVPGTNTCGGGSTIDHQAFHKTNVVIHQQHIAEGDVDDEGDEDDDDEEEEEEVVTPPKKRKRTSKKVSMGSGDAGATAREPRRPRVRNLKRSEQNKIRRNEGREYVGKNGVVVAARRMGDMCRCPLKCAERVPLAERERLFIRFWDTGNFDRQNAYLFGCMQSVPIKRRYGKDPAKSILRHCSFLFRVRCSDNEEQRVCKAAFMAIHGLQRNRGRLNNIMKKIKLAAPEPGSDGRGRHDNRPNRTSEQTLDSIHQHIVSVPKYVSRLSRQEQPLRVYLNCDLNTTLLYGQHYVPFCEEHGVTPASEDKYRRVIGASYNVGFKMPRADDTCKTCEFLQPSLDNGTPDQRIQAKHLKELHLWKVEALHTLLKEMSAQARETPHALHVVAVDVGPTLPTPKLACPAAFYRRRLWTYSVAVHDCGADATHVFLWDESTAPRGTDEIASCVLKYVGLRSVRAQRLAIFTNGSPTQTKNWRTMTLWHHLVIAGHAQEIEHYFLSPGHTCLPTDRHFAGVDKYHKTCEPLIYTPYHWAEVVGRAAKKKKLVVTQMALYDFFDLAGLENQVDHKNQCNDGSEVNFSEVICCRFQHDSPHLALIKYFMHEEFRRVVLKVRGPQSGCPPGNMQLHSSLHQVASAAPPLRIKYGAPQKIAQIKLNDLTSLLNFVPKAYQEFYLRLEGDGAPIVTSEPENVDGPANE